MTKAPEESGHVPTAEACNRAGITYRMLDYWIRRGWVQAVQEKPKSGYPRVLTEEEAVALDRMARLVRVGFTPERAAVLARGGLRAGRVSLGDGLWLEDTRVP